MLISSVGVNFNNTDRPLGPQAQAVRGHYVGAYGDSTLPAVKDRMHTSQQCTVIISEDILTTKYNSGLG